MDDLARAIRKAARSFVALCRAVRSFFVGDLAGVAIGGGWLVRAKCCHSLLARFTVAWGSVAEAACWLVLVC